MNGTIWETLIDFVKYLGKEGICHVDDTQKGWFVTWIDNSPKALAKQVFIIYFKVCWRHYILTNFIHLIGSDYEKRTCRKR